MHPTRHPVTRDDRAFEPDGVPSPPVPVSPVARVAPSAGGPTCGCGHGRQAHQHYRRGTDCSLCDCARYGRSLLARLLRRR
jgi:hypothetical protein